MMIEFAQTVMCGMVATESIVRRSSKEWKDKEANRRGSMTEYERKKEDIGKFLKNSCY